MAAERVGPKGKATGLDFNPGMLEAARLATPDQLSIEWIEADAEVMPLDDGTFDIVLCQMGLQFVPNKLAALREMQSSPSTGRPGSRQFARSKASIVRRNDGCDCASLRTGRRDFRGPRLFNA